MIADLIRAGVAPELVGRVSAAIADARSEGALEKLHAVRSAGAERQARWRARQKADDQIISHNVTRDVTNNVSDVTETGQNRLVPRVRAFSMGEEEDSTPNDASHHEAPKSKSVTRNAGSRLPEGYSFSAALREFGKGLGLTDDELDTAEAEFVDYWRGVPGARGRKSDWDATARNRLREIAGRKKIRAGPRLNGHATPYRTNTLMQTIRESILDADQKPSFDDLSQ